MDDKFKTRQRDFWSENKFVFVSGNLFQMLKGISFGFCSISLDKNLGRFFLPFHDNHDPSKHSIIPVWYISGSKIASYPQIQLHKRELEIEIYARMSD